MPAASEISPLPRDLARLDVGAASFDAPLSEHCTWRIGGTADLLAEPDDADQAARVVAFARRYALPLVVIGQGSNLLFADAGLRGAILKLGARFARIEVSGTRIGAQAGAWVPSVARLAQRSGLAGLEHIIGIPGTIGGLVLMNGGSQRRGIGENVRRVRVVEGDGRQSWLDPAECRFSYRHSALQERGAVVLGVELECSFGDPRAIRRLLLADLRERRRKFPRKEPNCGSVFLSTAAMHASVGPPGRIIEEAGLKGSRVGGAQVSFRHANFIVNTGGARAADVLSLIARIRAAVRERIGFELECEVRYVTPEGEVVPAHRAAPQR